MQRPYVLYRVNSAVDHLPIHAKDTHPMNPGLTPEPLEARLAALEAHVPAAVAPPSLVRTASPGRRTAPVLLAGILVLAVTATAAAAGVLNAIGHEGVENPGQPLAGAKLECMTPPAAAAYLTDRGFTKVVWQVESGDASGKAGNTSVQQATPPSHGYVVPGSIVDGTLYIVVDQRVGAIGSGACPSLPMP
jgi:hypothetical protein